MRLDKFLCDRNIGSRNQVKSFIKQGMITVNETVASRPEQKIEEGTDIVAFRGEVLTYQKYVYYLLNKPKGVVSATQDNTAGTVLELLPDSLRRRDLFPVGRLDKDTEGLLLITNDGQLAHNMLSPKKHVDKTYLVTLREELTPQAATALECGVDIGDEKLTAPARVTLLDEKHIYLTIHEGRFHQVKRMLLSVGNEVTALKRIRFGALTLEEALLPGEYRELTEQEVASIHEAQNDGTETSSNF